MATVTEMDREVLNLLRLDDNNPTRLISRENSRLEFKQSFNWSNRAKYGKALAAFANADGGFIVFGVRDAPRELVGVNEHFESLDLADMSEYLNSAYAPELEFEVFVTQLSEIRLGVVYVAPARERPVVSLKNDGQEKIREADIFYRYRARTERIRYPELQKLVLERQDRERELWLRHLSKIARIGVENVGVLDLIDGHLSGPSGNLLVSTELLEKVQFIRKGHFVEANEPGSPALRLIGDVQAIPPDALAPVRTVSQPLVIGEKEIMLGFLRQEQPEGPTEYIKQACRESSFYMPIYYFAWCAELDLKQLLNLVSLESRPTSRLRGRVEGALVSSVGSLDATTPQALERRQIHHAVAAEDVETLLHQNRTRLFEAITHFVPGDVPTHLLQFLANVVEGELDTMSSNSRTNCRKAIAHLDEALYRPSLDTVAEL